MSSYSELRDWVLPSSKPSHPLVDILRQERAMEAVASFYSRRKEKDYCISCERDFNAFSGDPIEVKERYLADKGTTYMLCEECAWEALMPKTSGEVSLLLHDVALYAMAGGWDIVTPQTGIIDLIVAAARERRAA